MDRLLRYPYSRPEEEYVRSLSLLFKEFSWIYSFLRVFPTVRRFDRSWALQLSGMILVKRNWATDRVELERTFATMKERKWPVCTIPSESG